MSGYIKSVGHAMSTCFQRISGQNRPLQNSGQNSRWQHLILKELDVMNAGAFPGVAQIVVEYIKNGVVFGPADWREYYGANVGNEELTAEAFQWWNSLDAITPFDPAGQPVYNSDTHYGFYYIPARYRPNPDMGEVPLHLQEFEYLAQQPKKGNPSRLNDKARKEAFEQNEKVQASAACWAAMRKGDVFFRGQTAPQQRDSLKALNRKTEEQMLKLSAQFGTRFGALSGTRYANFPDLRVLCILVRAHLTKTGERLLGDDTGAEKRITFSHTEQRMSYFIWSAHVEVGGHMPSYIGGSSFSGGLCICVDEDPDEETGVACVRMFPSR